MSADSGRADGALRFVGHYFIVLGLSTAIAVPLAALLNDRLSLDFICLTFVFTGWYLLKRDRSAWRFAVFFMAAMLLGPAFVFLHSFLQLPSGISVLGVGNPAPDLAALAFGLGLTLALPPLVVLWRPDVRRLVGTPPPPAAKGRYTGLYLLGLIVPCLSG